MAAINTADLGKKIASYIERTQPLIDAHAEERSTFIKRATQAAGVLAHRGVIDPKHVNDFIDKVAEDPASVWAFVEKLASAVASDSLGDVSSEKTAGEAKVDPWVKAFFPQVGSSNGMVE